MKQFTLILLLFITIQSAAQRVGIGTTSPDASAVLEVKSKTNGVLIPRLTGTEREAIANPATGLMVYDSTVRSFYYFNGTGWKSFKAATILEDEDGDTKVQVEKYPNEDLLRIELGGTERLILKPGRLEFPNNDSNVYIGYLNGFTNTTGIRNTGIGNEALRQNQTGSFNTALGFEANKHNNSGSWNTAIGYRSFLTNLWGNGNIAVGAENLFSNIDGNNNIGIGIISLYSNTTGDENIAIGNQAMVGNTQGNNNIAIGASALRFNTGRSRLIAIGDSALLNNGNGFFVPGAAENNIAIGFSALKSNTAGQSNIGIGPNTLLANTQGSRNTAVGMNALKTGITAIDNTAVGNESLMNSTGDYNTALGGFSLNQNTLGTQNAAQGYQALYLNTTGSQNTANGNQALNLNTTGSQNTAIGYRAAQSNISGTGITALGYNTTVGAANLLNATVIGANAVVNTSNSLILGNNAKVGIGISSPTSSLHVTRLAGVQSTAIFSGSVGSSMFNEGTSEDTHIRGGLNNSTVFLSNTPSGQVRIGSPFGNNVTEIYGKAFANNGSVAINVSPIGILTYEVSVNGDVSGGLNGEFQNIMGSLVLSATYHFESASGPGDASIKGEFLLDQAITSQYSRVIAVGHPNFQCTGTVSNALIYNLYSIIKEAFDNPAQKYLLAGMVVDDFPNFGTNKVYGTVIFYGVR